MSRHKRHRIKLRSMYLWHRYVGLGAALLVMLLAVTGLLLNHTDGLKLDQRYVNNEALLGWYGIEGPEHVTAYPVAGHWLSQWNRRLYLDRHELDAPAGSLHGAISYQDMIVAAVGNDLLLLTPQAELIERLGGADGVPAGMTAIGRTDDGKLAVSAAHGVYTVDADLLIWQEDPDAIVVWSDPAELPTELHERLLAQYRGTGLPLERVVLDLHSGRILGQGGVWLMDTAAVLMLFLAFSGSWLWLMRLIRNRQRRHK
jgi:hypothetical protein